MKWQMELLITIGIIMVVYGVSYVVTHSGEEGMRRSNLFGFGVEKLFLRAEALGEISKELVAEKKERKVTKTEYGFNHKITEWDDGTGNAIIGGQMYADSTGTKIEDARSLKDCEFCDNIKIHIDMDEKYPITQKDIIDYYYINDTNMVMELNPRLAESELNKDIPIEVYSKERIFNKKSQKFEKKKITHYLDTINFKNVNEKKTLTFPFCLDCEAKLGKTSSVITINMSTNAGMIHTEGPEGCTGIGYEMTVGFNYNWAVGNSEDFNGEEFRSFLQLNRSGISGNLINATLNMYLLYNTVESGNAFVYQCDYGTIEISDFENTVLGHLEGIIADESSPTGEYIKLSLNTSYIESSESVQYCSNSSIPCADTDDFWYTGDVNNPIYFNLTYITVDSCSCPSPAGQWDVLCSDNCDSGDCDISGYPLNINGNDGSFKITGDVYASELRIESCSLHNVEDDGNEMRIG